MPATPLEAPRHAARRRLIPASTSQLLTACLLSAGIAAPVALATPAAAAAPAGTAASAAYAAQRAPVAGPALPAEDRDRLRDAGVVADVPGDVQAPPELPASSYLLADLGSGDVLVSKGAHEPYLPASTMKLLTAQTLMPRLDAATKIAATQTDAAVDGTRVGMVPGREYTAEQLFHALLMGSANDAAEALARANGGLDKSLQQMSERAAQLGAKDTVPKSPHGLDAPGQQTTAYDLVAILRGALDTPQVAKVLTTQTFPFPKYRPVEQQGEAPSSAPSLAGSQQVASQNKLIWNYDGAIGGKDGYTDAAGHTYVGAVRRGDKTYAVAFMGAKSNDWKPMAGLLDWAFANGAKAKAVGKLPGAVAPVGAPAAPAAAATAAAPAEEGGILAAIVGFILTVVKVLLWTILILAAAVVALRVRKLRRDARRRLARQQRLQAASARPVHPAARPARSAPPAPAPAPASRPAAAPTPTSRMAPPVTAAYPMAADGTLPYPVAAPHPDAAEPGADDEWAVRPVGLSRAGRG